MNINGTFRLALMILLGESNNCCPVILRYLIEWLRCLISLLLLGLNEDIVIAEQMRPTLLRLLDFSDFILFSEVKMRICILV